METVIGHVDESRRSRRSGASDRRARAVVWGCWLAGVASSLTAVLANARNVPLREDWEVVPAMTGHEGHFLSWLWSQNNEHRVPVPRLVYLGLLKLWPDFRVGMVFNIVVLAAIAAGFIVFVRRLRGHTRWTDAFFPVAFLHLGHWENMGWSWQLQFVVAAALACALLVGVASERELTLRRALWFGGALVTVPLTGATAMPFASLVGLALVPELRRLRSRASNVLLGAVALNLVVTSVCFLGISRPGWVLPSPGLGATLGTGAKALALALGPGAGAWWLVSVLVVLALVGGAGTALYRSRNRRPWPLVAFLVAGAALALGVGQSRAGNAPWWGIPDRYALIAVPVLCCVYLVYERYGSAGSRRLGPALLCGAVVAVLPLNVAYGLDFRDWYQHRLDRFADDIKAGVPAVELTDDTRTYRYLHDAGIGVFSDLRLQPSRRTPGPRVDGLDADGSGWSTMGGRASVAALERVGRRTILRWDYNHSEKVMPLLGRSFASPQDWRGTGAIAIRFSGRDTGRRFVLRLLTEKDGATQRWDTSFDDDRNGSRTALLSWQRFVHVNAQGAWDWEGPMPLDRVVAVVFGVADEGASSMVIKRVGLAMNDAQPLWPLDSNAHRRSLPPWR